MAIHNVHCTMVNMCSEYSARCTMLNMYSVYNARCTMNNCACYMLYTVHRTYHTVAQWLHILICTVRYVRCTVYTMYHMYILLINMPTPNKSLVLLVLLDSLLDLLANLDKDLLYKSSNVLRIPYMLYIVRRISYGYWRYAPRASTLCIRSKYLA